MLFRSDACAAAGIKPFYGPFGDFSDAAACEAQFRNAFLMGCLGAWSLHPSQIEIAKKVFSPDPTEVAFAKKIVEAMPDGAGAVMILILPHTGPASRDDYMLLQQEHRTRWLDTINRLEVLTSGPTYDESDPTTDAQFSRMRYGATVRHPE